MIGKVSFPVTVYGYRGKTDQCNYDKNMIIVTIAR